MRRTFNCVKERVVNKIHAWKGKLFSMAGREILIKAVAQATSTYLLRRCLPRPSTFHPITAAGSGQDDWRVEELIQSGQWDQDVISLNFLPIDHEAILNIPLGRGSCVDRMIWHFERRGRYMVKSGYWVATTKKTLVTSSGGGRDRRWWGLLWSLNIPNKVKVFLWRSFQGILPSFGNLVKKGIKYISTCPRCREELESVSHVLWHCPLSKEVRMESAVWQCFSKFKGPTFEAACLFAAQFCSRQDLEVFSMLAWSIWGACNLLVHERSVLSALEIVQHWVSPPFGDLKLNVDAAVQEGLVLLGLGLGFAIVLAWWLGWSLIRGGNTGRDTTTRHEFRGFGLGKIGGGSNSGHPKLTWEKTGRVRVRPVEPEPDPFFHVNFGSNVLVNFGSNPNFVSRVKFGSCRVNPLRVRVAVSSRFRVTGCVRVGEEKI
ncbi:hypothetical protein TIFTF001_035490 [Ficus carica]|uniref:Reverse transcriptase zinc-binding domain-containing protein n=1 Tax=Ficus carica TaxID=3494 RepID=A0AA88J9R3_FICCA|nr:hypothetical protein TIFTF001_035490 [Ficus carica]